MTNFEAPIQDSSSNPDMPEEGDRELDKLAGIDTEINSAAKSVVGEHALRSESSIPSRRLDTVEARAAAGALKDRNISIAAKKKALGLDRPDTSHLDLSEEDKAKGDEAKDFITAMIDDMGTFDMSAYLRAHPEKLDDAKRLGFLKTYN